MLDEDSNVTLHSHPHALQKFLQESEAAHTRTLTPTSPSSTSAGIWFGASATIQAGQSAQTLYYLHYITLLWYFATCTVYIVFITLHKPSLHVFPLHPSTQVQVSGSEQVPPFRHGGVHTAEE